MRMLDLLHPAPLTDREIRAATVLDVRTNEGYSPLRLPQFFLDGSVAIPGKEPERLCTEYMIKLQPRSGRPRWISVSREAYIRATSMIGQPLGS